MKVKLFKYKLYTLNSSAYKQNQTWAQIEIQNFITDTDLMGENGQ